MLALVLVSVAAIRLRLAGVPLERDEGEYAYAGQLILQGIAPYELVYNMKFPGVYYAYSLILALFGQTPWGIHFGLLLLNAATTLLLFLFARRVIGERAGLVTAAAFALLSVDRWIMGVFAHATHFVILPAVAGLLLLIQAKRLTTCFAAGVLLGVSVLMKQHAAVFVLLGLGLVLWRDLRTDRVTLRVSLGRAATIALGVAVPFALLLAVLAQQGVVARFWTWTFQYAREYVSVVSWAGAIPALVEGLRSITVATWPLWLLAGVGLVTLWAAPWRRESRLFLCAFLVASFAATCPGFYFREHYFIVLLPAVAMLVGVGIVSLQYGLGSWLPARVAGATSTALFLAAVAAYGVQERHYLSSMSVTEVSRTRYGRNPFVEAPEIANYIERNTSSNDRIAVIGSEPEIYFYANRRSATGYVYMYPLMERQSLAPQMQDEMIREIEQARPEYIVFVTTPVSWLPRPDSDRRILEWANRYLTQCYDIVGIAERPLGGPSVMRWDAEVTGYEPQTPNIVYTLKRKPDAPC